ncbi:MAG: hypothetical protein ACYDAR_15305 [Thermomicrobiales bacterium]
MSSSSSVQPRSARRSTPRILAMTFPLLLGILVAPLMDGIGHGTVNVGAIGATANPYVERALLASPQSQGGQSSIALSSDASTAVVGQLYLSGAVAVYGKTGDTYRLIGNVLTNPTTPRGQTDSFGQNVGVSSDGTTVVVGDEERGGSGMVFVYTKSGNTYVMLGGAPIATGDATYKSVGSQVAISGDGATIIMAATIIATSQPAVLVYTKSGGLYSRTQVLTGGTSFVLSTDGATLAIGADGGSTTPGSVSVYVRSGGTYSPFGGTLTASDGVSTNRFGGVLAVSGDGATLAIAAYFSTLHPQQSIAYVFTKGVSRYSQGQEIVTVVGSATTSGYSGGLALNGDGTVLALVLAQETSSGLAK